MDANLIKKYWHCDTVLKKENVYYFCNEIKQIDTRGGKFMLSNAKVPLVMSNFSDFNYEEIVARRAINSKNPEATTNEVVIYN